MNKPVFIGSDIYRGTAFQPPHPLAVLRSPLVEDLCRAMGWLDAAQYRDSPMASVQQLTRFHDPAYIKALVRAEAAQGLPDDLRARYRIGADSNVIHPRVYRRPAISAGGAICGGTTDPRWRHGACAGGGQSPWHA
jgi:acetoin utilization protein AcuC